jgi:hypothetical protein
MLLSPGDYAGTALIFVLNAIGMLLIYHASLIAALIEATIVALFFYIWRLETELKKERQRRRY